MAHTSPNPPSSKFFDVVGEVVRRIHNPEQTSKKGVKYRLNYLVIKWVSGRNGEYVDYLKIKVFEGKKIADIREGYIVRVPLMYSCTINTDEVEYKTRNVDGTYIEEPSLWPEFRIPKNKEIGIIDGSRNYETHSEANKNFENEVMHPMEEEEDDLPF